MNDSQKRDKFNEILELLIHKVEKGMDEKELTQFIFSNYPAGDDLSEYFAELIEKGFVIAANDFYQRDDTLPLIDVEIVMRGLENAQKRGFIEKIYSQNDLIKFVFLSKNPRYFIQFAKTHRLEEMHDKLHSFFLK